MPLREFCLVALAAFAATAAMAEKPSESESSFNLKLGDDHSVGKYGQQRETALDNYSLTMAYDWGDYSLDLVAGYLRERGPGRVIFIPGRRPVIVVGPDRHVAGASDTTAGVTRYLLNEEDHGLDLDLGAIVKLATASKSKGLGTGKTDASIQASFGRTLGPVNTTLTTGYSFIGKSADLGLQNSAYGSFDANVKIGALFTVGATYSAGQTAALGTAGTRDLTGYLDFKPEKGFKIEAYFLKGYSNQSPDRGAGLTFGWDL